LACAKVEGAAALKEAIATANCNPVRTIFFKVMIDPSSSDGRYYTTDSRAASIEHIFCESGPSRACAFVDKEWRVR
jgi:hypothetical protein